MIQIPQEILNEIKKEAARTSELLKAKLVTVDRQNSSVVITYQGASVTIKPKTSSVSSNRIR